MKYVLDSSVAFKWEVRETDADKARRLRDDFRAAVHELLAPDVFPVEVAHSLTKAERQGRITDAEWLAAGRRAVDRAAVPAYFGLRARGSRNDGPCLAPQPASQRLSLPNL